MSLATPKWREIEEREGRPMTDVLINLYERYGHLSNVQEVIATELGISQPTLSQWIKYLRLDRKQILRRPEQPEGTN